MNDIAEAGRGNLDGNGDGRVLQADAACFELAAELRRVIEHERARADRLEAELRRPWWRRLIG